MDRFEKCLTKIKDSNKVVAYTTLKSYLKKYGYVLGDVDKINSNDAMDKYRMVFKKLTLRGYSSVVIFEVNKVENYSGIGDHVTIESWDVV